MILKVLTCDCIISYLKDIGLEFDVFTTFGACQCNEDHRIFATVCNSHPLNVTGFARNYFASVICRCVYEDKDKI